MLHISKSVDYAVRILVHLATLESGTLVRIETIARTRRLPATYIRQLIAPLIVAGLIESKRGAGGGLRLGTPAHAISLLTIIEAIDGPVRFDQRRSTNHKRTVRAICPISRMWMRTERRMRQEFKAVRLTDVTSGNP